MSELLETRKNLFLENLSLERRLSEYTARNYKHALNEFFEWLNKQGRWKGDIGSINRNHLRSYLVERQKDLSRRTVNNHFLGSERSLNSQSKEVGLR